MLGRGQTRRPAIDPILVINPNSSEVISAQIREAVASDSAVQVVTSRLGPPAIETDQDVATAIGPMLEVARAEEAAAVVVACFSDPGLDQLRAESAAPAFGIAESAVRRALELGRRVGVISSVEDSLPRHARYWERLGVQDGVIADIALGLGVLELDSDAAFDRARQAGRELVEAGADAIVLGCTGMTHMQGRLERELGIPVIDPCLAGVEAARRALEGEAP
jgi:Asp/Glu/hydantoin racemase